MSIMRRVRDITVATLNERLEKAEDPVKLIDQFLWSTREDILQAERLYEQYTGHTNHLKIQWLQAEQQKEKREQQAMTALKAGEEQLARLALHEKASSEERAAQYRDLYEQSRLNTLGLEEQLREMRSEYQSVYDRREYYAARMESLRLQQRMNARFSGIGEQGAQPGSMFRRLEDSISNMELEAKSLHDLRRMGREFATEAGHSIQSAIEQELEQLKRKLQKEG
ncbi:PspA/IM30 family protein [Paenibacillus algorifonticola]|uniref:Phage shock protein A (PspA) family protein n=2 Tax=Paenibacillus TaxID=44249 RepID=A0A1I2FUB4_9BACL|nr:MULTISPECIES: PspA/IM30 family protein [Paenibacillus]ANY67804.1 phage shock protein A [Paenibacillus sp. BIHB 4019]KQN98876.1 phage shock protein A [Paenibacillus sp. Leaf72]SFF08240.1 phage shock protein A (PspA) family protein [Paenibacillus algorifonticola]